MKKLWVGASTLVACLALSAAAALACSPVKSIDVCFEPDSQSIAMPQIVRLVEWADKLRVRYPNRGGFLMGGVAERSERGGKALALARGRAVADLFEQLELSGAPVVLSSRGDVHDVGTRLHNESYRRVEIDFLPACPHECPCQLGDPLYKPPAAPAPAPGGPALTPAPPPTPSS